MPNGLTLSLRSVKLKPKRLLKPPVLILKKKKLTLILKNQRLMLPKKLELFPRLTSLL